MKRTKTMARALHAVGHPSTDRTTPAPRVTLARINDAIRKLGGAEQLVRGNAYFYFIDGDAAAWPASSVYVYRLNALTLDQWVEEWRTLRGVRPVAQATPGKPLHPYCQACGWRKGGPDSWNGAACKCGHSEPPIRPVRR